MTTDALYERATDAVERQNYDYAIELLFQIIQQNPRNVKARQTLWLAERRKFEKGASKMDALKGFGSRFLAGIHALTIDFRGHGGSSAGTIGPDGEPDVSRLVLDVRAARLFLASRPDLVRPGAIGIAGASIGANVAILEAASDLAIKTVALLSPGLDYRSLRIDAAMRKYAERPALLVAATDDPYALRSVKQLATLGGGPRETKTLEAAGHGTTMLGRDPDLIGALVDWFQRTLLS